MNPHPALLDKVTVPSWYKYIIRPIYSMLLPIIIPLKLMALIPIALSSLLDYLLNLGTDPSLPLPKWRFAIYCV